ncbi:hypothetical protein BDM02DRAFT_3165435 [Thelephora ganbajun]|uniref:Uncharacterized protein n=1 Tax=Thelephora ganbajun TaxID=370292 RepID=A0ACB6ZLH8_THEGA|nr:hypothetical protein BDM02DRAFT_3165435 [Thelephora ganbajun]
MAMRVEEKKRKGRRETVPTALRSELEEYSFLLRALRTNDTLDLSSQLVRATGSSQTLEDDDDARDLSSASPVEASGSNSGSHKPKDNWTRWPLLIQDVPIPEWTLQDEVERLANKFLRPPGNPDEETEEDVEEPIEPTAVKYLTLETTEYLSHLLAAIAAHVPMVKGSMQNRLRPLNWENVLAIVGATGLVDPSSIERASECLKGIYGASELADLSVHRTRLMKESHDQLLQMCSSIDKDFLSIQVPPTKLEKRKKGTRGKYNLTGKYNKKRKLFSTSAVPVTSAPQDEYPGSLEA